MSKTTPDLRHYLTEQALAAQVRAALDEDLGDGDLTVGLISTDKLLKAEVLCREPATICGTAWFNAVFAQLSSLVHLDWHVRDGDAVAAGTPLCALEGPAHPLLSGERTALNFLQTLSGTATETARFARALVGTKTRLLDTRKTIPGLRAAQKYAVACGGGSNHRMGLFDAILIKENHIAAAGSITAALEAARSQGAVGKAAFIEVEVETLAEVDEALAAGATRLLLDNFTPDMLHDAVRRAGGRAELEVSGNVSLEHIGALSQIGVDYVSVGALTKHVRAIDLSMRFLND